MIGPTRGANVDFATGGTLRMYPTIAPRSSSAIVVNSCAGMIRSGLPSRRTACRTARSQSRGSSSAPRPPSVRFGVDRRPTIGSSIMMSPARFAPWQSTQPRTFTRRAPRASPAESVRGVIGWSGTVYLRAMRASVRPKVAAPATTTRPIAPSAMRDVQRRIVRAVMSVFEVDAREYEGALTGCLMGGWGGAMGDGATADAVIHGVRSLAAMTTLAVAPVPSLLQASSPDPPSPNQLSSNSNSARPIRASTP